VPLNHSPPARKTPYNSYCSATIVRRATRPGPSPYSLPSLSFFPEKGMGLGASSTDSQLGGSNTTRLQLTSRGSHPGGTSSTWAAPGERSAAWRRDWWGTDTTGDRKWVQRDAWRAAGFDAQFLPGARPDSLCPASVTAASRFSRWGKTARELCRLAGSVYAAFVRASWEDPAVYRRGHRRGLSARMHGPCLDPMTAPEQSIKTLLTSATLGIRTALGD